MSTIHVGLPSLRGDVTRYATKFDLLEVRPVDTSLPRPNKLRQWRKDVPPAFVFSVVLPAIVAELKPSREAEVALQTTLDVADALQARCLVLVTPAHVTPTVLNKKRLKTLMDRLPQDVVTVAWEPRGIWDVMDAAAVARSLGVTLVVDATQERPPRGAVMYTRLRGMGQSASLSPAALSRVRQAMGGRREVFAVIETTSPAAIAEALRRPLKSTKRASAISVVRPPIMLSAEDEEQ